MAKKPALRRYLKKNKMSVATLSKRSGVPRSTISGWLNDGSMPRVDQARMVAEATGGLVSETDLIEGAKLARKLIA